MINCPETRYHDELNRKAEAARRATIEAYYAANPRVRTWEKKVIQELRRVQSLFRPLAYALTRERTPQADKLMGVTDKPTGEIVRDYSRACRDLQGARLRLEEIR